MEHRSPTLTLPLPLNIEGDSIESTIALMPGATYVGDRVYFAIDPYYGQIVLQTSVDGTTAENTIYLDPQTWPLLYRLLPKGTQGQI